MSDALGGDFYRSVTTTVNVGTAPTWLVVTPDGSKVYVAKDNSEQVCNFAWLAMTVEPVDLRDPRTVLPYAQKAVEMSGGTDEYSLHNLAETYSAMGDYAKAVETGEKATALFPALQPGAPKPSQQETIEKSLQEYRDTLAKRKK